MRTRANAPTPIVSFTSKSARRYSRRSILMPLTGSSREPVPSTSLLPRLPVEDFLIATRAPAPPGAHSGANRSSGNLEPVVVTTLCAPCARMANWGRAALSAVRDDNLVLLADTLLDFDATVSRGWARPGVDVNERLAFAKVEHGSGLRYGQFRFAGALLPWDGLSEEVVAADGAEGGGDAPPPGLRRDLDLPWSELRRPGGGAHDASAHYPTGSPQAETYVSPRVATPRSLDAEAARPPWLGRPCVLRGPGVPERRALRLRVCAGDTLLHLVVRNGRKPSLTACLLRAGVDPQARNELGATAAELAEAKALPEPLRLLLAAPCAGPPPGPPATAPAPASSHPHRPPWRGGAAPAPRDDVDEDGDFLWANGRAGGRSPEAARSMRSRLPLRARKRVLDAPWF